MSEAKSKSIQRRLETVSWLEEMALICWVPEDYVPNAQAEIDVNPEGVDRLGL